MFELLIFYILPGLIAGSFLNVVIVRLPAMLEAYYLDKPCKVNLFFPASHCPTCKNKLALYHNIPVFSWLFLRGRCAFCDVSISIRYPLVELLTVLLTVLVGTAYGATVEAVIGIALTWVLLCLTFIDIRTYSLPDELTLGMLWGGLTISVFGGFTSSADAIIGAISGYISLWLLYHAFKLITGKEGLGYGDMKLLAALGAVFGWQALPFIVLTGTTLGLIITLIFLLMHKTDKDAYIPFAPYLSAGAFAYLLIRSPLISFVIP